MPVTLAITWQDWSILGFGLALFAGFLWLAWRALSGDPPGDRRRCPRCWYEMTQLPGMRCPECGFEATSERAFRRRKRRPGVALLATVACVAVGLISLERVRRDGWTTYLPTRVIIALVQWNDRTYGDVHAELRLRIRTGRLDDDDWLALIDRCVTGDAGERPPGRAWEVKYSGLLRRSVAAYQSSTDSAWKRDVEAMLDRLPPRIDATAPATWPADVPPAIGVRAVTWWGAATPDGLRLRAEPRDPSAPARTFALRGGPIQPRSFTVEVPRLAPGAHEIALDVVTERRTASGWKALHRDTFAVPIDVVEGPRLEPVSSAALETAVRQAVGTGLVHHPRGALPVRVVMDYRRTGAPAFADVAIGIEIEVIRNGQLGRRLDVWWLAGPSVEGSGQRAEWEVPFHDDAVLGPPPAPDDVWTVRATSARRLALRVEDATHCWVGTIETPVQVQARTRPAPDRGWVPVVDAPAADDAGDTMRP